MDDKKLLETYYLGFNDELNSNERKSYGNLLLRRAYVLGALDAKLGDDFPALDYRSEESIIKSIRKNEENI